VCVNSIYILYIFIILHVVYMNKCQLYTNVSIYIYVLHIATYYGGFVAHHVCFYHDQSKYACVPSHRVWRNLSYVVFMMTLYVYICVSLCIRLQLYVTVFVFVFVVCIFVSQCEYSVAV